MKKYYIAINIGCLECCEATEIITISSSRQKAKQCLIEYFLNNNYFDDLELISEKLDFFKENGFIDLGSNRLEILQKDLIIN